MSDKLQYLFLLPSKFRKGVSQITIAADPGGSRSGSAMLLETEMDGWQVFAV